MSSEPQQCGCSRCRTLRRPPPDASRLVHRGAGRTQVRTAVHRQRYPERASGSVRVGGGGRLQRYGFAAATAAPGAAALPALAHLAALPGHANLEETTANCSALGGYADRRGTRAAVRPRLPRPGGALWRRVRTRLSSMVVIALGKLGAGELNLQSDVDLMFCLSGTRRTARSQMASPGN